ncbi:hypothetical protein B1J93_06570 [Leptospira kirschneri serovar Pomona]|uniref:Uncharacterized protein n=1 Tax=Leptospira kirschneri serovar Pomona TaxID=561005 RepID=A0A1T1DTD4_9LEPT|nr:hypothetical protein [Leptospira sp. ZV016]KXZ24429.1 hypothetical protein AYB32_05315 [Leptospira kirschneri]KXZ27763.1 hypothetical protein AYB34_04185 [Leptospira sp. ZV016]OOV44125.1 hypothetical protein B1J93_06570 [Leptospira kirschneri serovar Pomona]
MVFNFIRIGKTISCQMDCFYVFDLYRDLLLRRMKTIIILKPISKLKMWDLAQKANNFKLDIIF